MKLDFYCKKCGAYLESPKYSNDDNDRVDFSIEPCQKCLENAYKFGEKAAIDKLIMLKKLKTEQNIELYDLIETTEYGNLKI